MKKENQRIFITKQMLREALIRLLHKKPLDQISVTELCREADINRATFYRHYEIPRDVLLEIEKEIVTKLNPLQKLPKTSDEGRVFIHQLCAYMDKYNEQLRLIVSSHSDHDMIALLNSLYITRIQQVVQSLPFSKPLDQDGIKLLASYGAGGGYNVLRQWVLGNIQKTPAEIADLICDLLFSTDWRKLASQLGLPAER